MGSLSGLPTELISHIWSHVVQPKDVENFALMSRENYALGLKFIEEHQRLKKKYGDGVCGSPPAKFLAEILLNPRAALYVKKITIDGWRVKWDGPATLALHHARFCHMPYPEDTMQLFEEAVRTSAFIPESEGAGWVSEIGRGDESNILALIISLLPNVRRFMLIAVIDEGRRLSQMIRQIGKSPTATALSCLTDVELGWVDTEGVDIDFEWVEVFSSLKSVKDIKGWGVGQLDEESEYWSSLPPRWSNVTSLQLHCCEIEYNWLFIYLKCVRSLRNLSYTAAGRDSPFYPLPMCTALAHGTDSLETLHVSSSDGTGSHMGSLAELNVLTELSTEYRMLVDCSAEFDNDRSMQMLPPSIEKVLLEHNDRYDVRSLRRQIIGICKLKADHFPKLKVLTYSINVDTIDRPKPKQQTQDYIKDSETIAALKQMCVQVGVELSIGQLDRDWKWLPYDERFR